MKHPNMRMIVENLIESATLNATSNALPVDYVKRAERVRVWRSEGVSQQVITGSWPSAGFVNGFTIYRHNLSSAASVKLRYFLDGEVVFDSGSKAVAELIPPPLLRLGVDPWGATYNDKISVPLTSIWLEPIAVDGFELTIDDDSNPDGFMQIGMLVTGLSLSLRYNPSYGSPITCVEKVEQMESEAGSLRTISSGNQYRVMNLKQNMLPEEDFITLITSLTKMGKKANIFVSLYPEQGGVKEVYHAYVGRRMNDFEGNPSSYNIWQSLLEIREV